LEFGNFERTCALRFDLAQVESTTTSGFPAFPSVDRNRRRPQMKKPRPEPGLFRVAARGVR
jgi:hypothetical protein